MANEDGISEADDFANVFFYFIKALKVLAKDADAQCEYMGNYNVAWELKSDVSAGAYLLNLPGELTQREKDGIAAMVAALNELPVSLLAGATTETANKKAMNAPDWVPLRVRAAELLRLLSGAIRKNEAFLASDGPTA